MQTIKYDIEWSKTSQSMESWRIAIVDNHEITYIKHIHKVMKYLKMTNF